MVQRTGVLRPGGRTARTRAAVHAAVRELVQSGQQDLQMSAVAARSGVHAATIYRRWGSLPALLLDVAVADAAELAPVPVTGDLARDLLEYARRLHATVSSPGGLHLLRAIMAAAADPAVGPRETLALLQGRLDQFQQLLDGARERTALTVVDLIDGLLAPVYLRALLSRPSTLQDDDLVRLVENLLAVHRSRAAPPAERDA